MDERTKATVRALLDLYPRGYAAERGIQATNSAAGLFRLLCLSVLADDAVPSEASVAAARALLDAGWDSAPEMAKSDEGARAEVLREAGYEHAEAASRWLGQATELALERYGGDLKNLRAEADGDRDGIRRLLEEFPGVDDAGIAVFFREAQAFWPEIAPFADERALDAAERVGLPADAGELMNDVARGTRNEQLSWIVGALVLVDENDDYDRIMEKAGA